jgi:hypothetical protein
MSARRAPLRFAVPLTLAGLLPLSAPAQPPLPGERGTPRDEPRSTQRADQSPPPSAPEATPVDPGAPLPPLPPIEEPRLRLRRETGSVTPAQPPAQFNPDPGAGLKPPVRTSEPYFTTNQVAIPASPEEAPVPADRALPRSSLERTRMEATQPHAQIPRYGREPLAESERLPRAGTRENRFIPNAWHAPDEYPLSKYGAGFPDRSTPSPDRWRSTGFVPWRRYTSGATEESPYAHPEPARWHPYRQSLLKGDLPIRGNDLFLSLTAAADLVHEDRKLPSPSGVSASRAGSFDFFGGSRSQAWIGNLALQADLFRGATVFKPVEWLVRVRPVLNYNRTRFHEAGLASPDPRGNISGGVGSGSNNTGVTNPGDIDALLAGKVRPGPESYTARTHTVRSKNYIALQEAFYEKHLRDLSPNYDFLAVKVGNQTFNSDFRGFIFNDTNLGARLFGNYDNNHWQYNLAVFDLREKDTNSDLNTFERRGQIVAVANVYRQDFWEKGYTAQLSIHASFDESDLHYDTNGGIIRPAPLGTIRPHRVNSYYLGWAGDGHLGRWNISHALYLATGRDDFNGLAGRPVDILAQLGAIELSYDRDWIRFKASLVYASGDHDATDRQATGFDSILDNTNFTGGPFSYYVRQGFNLGGTAVGVKQRFSLLPNLRTSKTQGQQNFVNPGLALGGLGADIEVTPKLRAFVNASYLRFDSTHPIRTALVTNQIDRELGIDVSLGLQWRPLLTDNWIVSLGSGVLRPGRGFRDIYRRTQPAVPGFTDPAVGSRVDRILHSTVLASTVTY